MTAAIIARLQAATAETQGEAIREAISHAHVAGWIPFAAALRGYHMIDVRAYVDAALLLVPEGWRLWRMDRPNPAVGWNAQLVADIAGHARTSDGTHDEIAIAIALAAVQAQQQREQP